MPDLTVAEIEAETMRRQQIGEVYTVAFLDAYARGLTIHEAREYATEEADRVDRMRRAGR